MLKFNSFIKESSDNYTIGDIVLIRYWLTGDITPVKIIEEKTKNYFIVSHKVEYSELFNAPNHGIKKSEILGLYKGIEDPFNPENRTTENPRNRPNTSGIIPGWDSFSNDMAF